MKRMLLLSLVLCLALTAAAPFAAAAPPERALADLTPASPGASDYLPLVAVGYSAQDQTQTYVENQIVVRFNELKMASQSPLALGEQVLGLSDSLPNLGIFVLEVSSGEMESAMQALRNNPDVAWVEPNYLVKGAMQPNDPHYNDPAKVYAPQLIGAPTAWDSRYPSPDIILAVADSGLSLKHPEFAGRIFPGYDFSNQDGDPSDDRGHGTHVTGIAAATLDNFEGIAGIAPNVSIMPVKVLNASGIGTTAGVASGIFYAVDHGARVINLSLVLPWDTQLLRDAVRYAADRGVLVVAAVGNAGGGIVFYPAGYPEVLAVGATDRNDALYPVSNYGDFVDVVAPGVDIWSTSWSIEQPAGYASRTGTSMATAHVSGLAALLLSIRPTLTADDLRTVIQQTAVDLGSPGWDPYFGHGRINAGAAVTLVRSLYVRRVNCGDKAYTDGRGVTWDVNQKWDGAWGSTEGGDFHSDKPVEGTEDDPLYQNLLRNPGEYRFSVPNGVYRITLRFAEFEARKAGERVAQIAIENNVVEPALDIFATVGIYTALDRIYQATVTDGELNIAFTKVAGKDPVISAIEVAATLPSTETPSFARWINSGDKAYTDSQGVTWDVDQKWDGAWGAREGDNRNSSALVAGTEEDVLYQTWRRNPKDYRFSVPNGTYRITLRFAEFEVAKAGDRVMQIAIEGAVVEPALDIFATVGRYAALDRTYQATVTDGELNVTFVKLDGKDPIVSAIEVHTR